MQVNTLTMSMSAYDPRGPGYSSSQDAINHSGYAPHPQSAATSFRSFAETNGTSHRDAGPPPQIYTAIYSGVQVYEMEVNDVAVMRRRSDSWLNATQVLKVAGVDKGKRTKIIEREILTGEHEKVQGGYGKYQGTWVNYRRGREFCRQYGVEELLRPLLEYDISSDGNGIPGVGVSDTPTKEQALAAHRKRLYTQTQDARQSQGSNGGTFFSNLSSTASNAISAMNKAARLSTPIPRPGSAQRRAPSMSGRSMPNSQESFTQYANSQRSMPGLQSERSFGANDVPFSSQHSVDPAIEEPPRKKIRAGSMSSSYVNGEADVTMRDGTPTEANESFYRPSSQVVTLDGEVPVALAPLPHPIDKRTEEKQSLLLDLFADSHRTDYANHPALQHLSGADLEIPLDQVANTALHWAATLARVPLMKLLIAKGANMFRGNIAGETPLMSAVGVNNCLDHTCFPEVLNLLHPLIELRDVKGRTILHHISVASGVKGRAVSSKYYLEALLEFLVRQTSSVPNSGSSYDGMNGTAPRPLGLMRFMSEMVNARDISGNTALNLAARIGNKSIIHQLMEVQADPTIPNHKGLTPIDFGVKPTNPDASQQITSVSLPSTNSQVKAPSKTDEASRDLIPSLSSAIGDIQTQFSDEMRLLQERVDSSTSQIRDLSTQQNALSIKVEAQLSQIRSRQDRKQRIQNLKRAISDMRDRITSQGYPANQNLPTLSMGDADRNYPTPESTPTAVDLKRLPDLATLNSWLSTYNSLNASLSAHLNQLKLRDSELEAKYRKVVALCTNVEENKVDSLLSQLVLAVESEPENDVGRVREFLKRVEAVSGTA